MKPIKGKKVVIKSSAIQTTKEADCLCLICDELHIDDPTHEDWMQCRKCSGQAHEACTADEQSTGYIANTADDNSIRSILELGLHAGI